MSGYRQGVRTCLDITTLTHRISLCTGVETTTTATRNCQASILDIEGHNANYFHLNQKRFLSNTFKHSSPRPVSEEWLPSEPKCDSPFLIINALFAARIRAVGYYKLIKNACNTFVKPGSFKKIQASHMCDTGSERIKQLRDINILLQHRLENTFWQLSLLVNYG